MTKRFFIIPGFTHKPTDKCYRWLSAFLKEQGFAVQPVTIHWKRRVMSDYVAEFIEQYEKYKGDENYVLGFSFGAMIAFISAPKIRPNKLFLCSLSPYFTEDPKNLSQADRRVIGKNRLEDFKNFSAEKIAKEIHVPTVIFCGEKEGAQYPDLLQRCRHASTHIAGAKLVFPKDAPHEIDYPTYVEAIKKHSLHKCKICIISPFA